VTKIVVKNDTIFTTQLLIHILCITGIRYLVNYGFFIPLCKTE